MTNVGQTEFTTALLNPSLAPPSGLVDPSGRPAGKRFDVYRNNVVSSLLDAMETAFPVVVKIVGEKFFRAMSGVYIRQHPPTSPLLMFYGADFPEFLAGFEPAANLPYLPDVARLELARRTAYHAANAVPIAPQTLAEIPPENIGDARFELAPAVHLLTSEHPIHSIWHHNMVDQSTKVPAAPQSVLLYRPEFDVDALNIPPALYTFLTQLADNQTLSNAAAAAEDVDPEFDLSAAIGICINTAIIIKIYV